LLKRNSDEIAARLKKERERQEDYLNDAEELLREGNTFKYNDKKVDSLKEELEEREDYIKQI
jgi:hypothetical protein